MLYTNRTFSFEHPLNEADICLLGIPFTSTQTGRPVKYGPLFIREAIRNLVGWDPELKMNIFEKLKFCDLGDLEVVPGNWGLTEKNLAETIRDMFQQNPGVFPVFLGGEHLITLGIVKALAEIKGPLTVVHLDAHRDLKKDWLGEKHSHITWAYRALKDKSVKLVQLGCRIWDPDEEEAFQKLGVKETLEGLEGPVYLTLDLDVFDPRHAPEVGTPQPNGLSPQDVFKVLKEISRHQLLGMDINECASSRVNTPTALLAGEVFKKVLGYRSAYGIR